MSDFPVALDPNGFLVEPGDWTPELAEKLAERDGILLTKAHWAIIIFLREFYQAHHKPPAVRTLVSHLGKILDDPNKGTGLYLHQLFPQGPTLQASRIAGLPKPARCL